MSSGYRSKEENGQCKMNNSLEDKKQGQNGQVGSIARTADIRTSPQNQQGYLPGLIS